MYYYVAYTTNTREAKKKVLEHSLLLLLLDERDLSGTRFRNPFIAIVTMNVLRSAKNGYMVCIKQKLEIDVSNQATNYCSIQLVASFIQNGYCRSFS